LVAGTLLVAGFWVAIDLMMHGLLLIMLQNPEAPIDSLSLSCEDETRSVGKWSLEMSGALLTIEAISANGFGFGHGFGYICSIIFGQIIPKPIPSSFTTKSFSHDFYSLFNRLKN